MEYIVRLPGWLARGPAGPLRCRVRGGARRLRGPRRPAFLLAPTSRADLDGFARHQLGPLLDYDEKRGTELTRTLDVYLAAGCSTRRTAELLCIHHRTVSYRLARVTELTGLSLDDQEDRFRVQLACKILALGGRADRGDA